MIAIRRILLPTDFSRAALDAEERARALARLFEAELHLLHVTRTTDLSSLPSRMLDAEKSVGRRRFRHMLAWMTGEAESMQTTGGRRLPVRRIVRTSTSPSTAILDYAADAEVDLIVLGTQGQSARRGPWLGTVADRVVRRADRPVVTVRPDLETERPPAAFPRGDRASERLIVVPVRLSTSTPPVISHAKHWAHTFRAAVDVVHVVESRGLFPTSGPDLQRPVRILEMRDRLARAVEHADGPDVDHRTQILFGDPSDAIATYADAQEARLVLMTPGRVGLRKYVLGGVTESVVRRSRCPVCTLTPNGHAPPRRANTAHPSARPDTARPDTAGPDTAHGHIARKLTAGEYRAGPVAPSSRGVRRPSHALDLPLESARGRQAPASGE